MSRMVRENAVSGLRERIYFAQAEMAILGQALADRADLIAWLDGEMQGAMGAAGLARRPAPPSDANALNLMAEDRYASLAEGDLERLSNAIQRVSELVAHCVGYLEEW